MTLAAARPSRFAAVRPSVHAKGRDWFACRRLRGGTTYLRWTDLFEFLVSADGRDIRYHALPRATPESLAAYLLGLVLSFSLLAGGEEPLHGTAMVVDGEAIGLLGGCGSGKSTLGAAFLRLGCPVLTDDLMALQRTAAGWLVHPGMPRIKLFPAAARRVLGARGAGVRLNPGTTKRILPLGDDQASPAPVRLRTLYVLERPARATRSAAAPVTIEPLSTAAACLELIRASFNTIVFDRDRLARQFRLASRLAAEVPVRRLFYPRSLARLPAVCEAVLADRA